MMQRSEAETIALSALGWAAADGDALIAFLRISGLELEDLRARAADPELLGALLDFILAHESHAEAFCTAAELPAERLHAARRALPGAAPD